MDNKRNKLFLHQKTHSTNQPEQSDRYSNPPRAEESNLPPLHAEEIKGLINIKDMQSIVLDELKQQASDIGVVIPNNVSRQDLIFIMLEKLLDQRKLVASEGVLEIVDTFGFIRSTENNYVASPYDIYIAPHHIRKFGLRTGDTIMGTIKLPKNNERYFAMGQIIEVNFQKADQYMSRISFESLTPIFPQEKFILDNGSSTDLSTRILDIVAPIGKGQRAVIVAPPRTGKTIFMENIAHAIKKNHPDIYLIALLIDERPEEVTDFKRSIDGEVVSSTFDEPAKRHVQLAEIVIEKAKRLVELKRDVVIMLDSITRLARAYNTECPPSNKVLTGGIDAHSLQYPKKFFGAARNLEEGGSLTIVGTALIETGSRMDEVIFEEFKGTGNSEIVLDRKISERRLYPAIDINKSGTRKEELLIDRSVLSKTWILRKILNPMNNVESIEFLLSKLSKTKSNSDFFEMMVSNGKVSNNNK
jgi:transcription termination factor Rho